MRYELTDFEWAATGCSFETSRGAFRAFTAGTSRMAFLELTLRSFLALAGFALGRPRYPDTLS
jgi:hypothetical protein